MDLPIDDNELSRIIKLLKDNNEYELAERLIMIRKLQKQGKPYKAMLRQQGWVI
jgi:hypothetical protein